MTLASRVMPMLRWHRRGGEPWGIRLVGWRGSAARYLFALLAVAVALVLRELVSPLTGRGAPFVLFFGATLVTSLLAGLGPGLFALAISLPLAAFAFIVRAGDSWAHASFQAGLYAIDGLVIIYLMSRTRRARDELQRANDRLANANEAIARSAGRTREVIDLAPDALFLSDQDGRLRDVNRAACQLLGYAGEELVGRRFDELLPADDVPRLLASLETARANGGEHRGEWTLERKDRTTVPVEMSARFLPDGRWQAFARDITARRRMEDERQVFVSLIENASDFIGIADPTGRPVYVNPAGRKLVGLGPDQPLEQTRIPDYYPPEARSFASDVIVKTMVERGRWAGETWFRNWQTEAAIPVSDAHFMIRDASGQRVLGMGTITRDISEARHVAEEREELLGRERLARQQLEAANAALRLSEARFSGIISVAADAIISIDEGQRITLFNEGARRIFGYSPEEVLGRPLEVLIPERLRHLHREHVAAFAASRVTARQMGERLAAITGLRKSGEEFPAEAAISNLQVGDQRILTVALRDISARKRIEREQRLLADAGAVLASSLDYEQTLATVGRLAVREFADWCFVDVVDEEGAPRRLKVVSRDPALAPLCEEVERFPLDRGRPHLARSALETRRPYLLERVTPEDVAALAQGPEHLRILRALNPLSLLEVPLLIRGRLLGVVVFISSTPSRVFGAEEVRLGEALAERAAVAMENGRLYRQAVQAKSLRDHVLGVVAHDLRNPLSTIVLQASALRRKGPEPERRRQRPVEVIERVANRMNRLIEDLLDITRLEAGQLSLERAWIAPEDLLHGLVESQAPLATSASLELRLEPPAPLPRVWADRSRLEQVLENLVGNAIKFTRPGGRIRIGAEERVGELVMWVADTGRGIVPDELPRVFDRFWQAQKATRRGAGLGLPIARGIVEAHGGRIWVESAPGAGSTFFLAIPTRASGKDAAPEAGERALHGQSS